MIFLYNIFGIVFLILSPFIILIRIISGKEDKNRFLEKYSLNIKNNNIQTIWFHGASVGEIMTILPIIKKFEDNKKIKKILLTSSTTSSASIIKRQNFKKTTHNYYPFDIGFICDNFLKKWKPKIAIFVDSEIWPNMYERLYSKKIPIILINGRITKKSFERWSKIPSFANNIFSKVSIALPQNKKTIDYLNRLGVKKIKFIGNLKYFKNDKSISKANIKKYFKNKLVFCAASTHYNEEIIIARLHLDLKQKFKNLITIIIPRHINRSEDIIKDLKNLKLKVIKRSNGLKRSNDCDVLIVDTYGEMSNFLELSNLAFIGGSIINHGGQNPLEAVRMGNYVMHGRKIENFKEIYKELKNYEISSQVKNISEMKQVFVRKYNYKKSKNKIKRIDDLGRRIFKENIKVIQNYL
mgnify:CR=1 FL=1|tara:strand:- start:1973 stop:3202 length:1230 start_codon:yes stop_codon:yes gene_type:complete